ncbi:symmetrical bis(5'-nucleosyl)-tetraphosphatase [Ignatzschineria indica]|uniref:symmetrical bis(5'-nucleosyl)-tetraphosphatase n=1 Tax=Ignatzschineria indica TaxID=472583 RepID=UPI0025758AD1|nr:symmetrical bis(5'-nucleosyl)-tetraphosphatase [Ignatzschineria indica]MDM1545028.1 symmetrical bis(5'-nucleosyl)-tetraphosphatase [Ignatzschineria indica]
MATYVMGDIHGCFDEFQALLTKINFKHQEDRLYLVGDLINRGPKSLAVMEYLLAHQDSIFPILGNHDLSYLVYAEGYTRLKRGDTYQELLESPLADEIREYLRHQPLMRYLPQFKIAIAHAGIPPFWSIEEALKLSKEAQAYLQSSDQERYQQFIQSMFGNTPNAWSPTLQGFDRIRAIINYLTRMRYLNLDLSLDFANKLDQYDEKVMLPWFKFERPKQEDNLIIFGHWASLGRHFENRAYGIDSGCVWEGELSLIRVDQRPFEVTSFSF